MRLGALTPLFRCFSLSLSILIPGIIVLIKFLHRPHNINAQDSFIPGLLLAWKLKLSDSTKAIFMKKTIGKFLNESLKKIKQHKEQIKKFSFLNYKEDFVITEQEEREGGFFGDADFKLSSFKYNPSLR